MGTSQVCAPGPHSLVCPPYLMRLARGVGLFCRIPTPTPRISNLARAQESGWQDLYRLHPPQRLPWVALAYQLRITAVTPTPLNTVNPTRSFFFVFCC